MLPGGAQAVDDRVPGQGQRALAADDLAARTPIRSARAARALIALGLPRGGKVAILGFNRPEWVIFDHAAMMAGGAAAGIYTTCSAEEVQYIVHHAEALVVLVENAEQLAKIKAQARASCRCSSAIVMMRGATATGDRRADVGRLPRARPTASPTPSSTSASTRSSRATSRR